MKIAGKIFLSHKITMVQPGIQMHQASLALYAVSVRHFELQMNHLYSAGCLLKAGLQACQASCYSQPLVQWLALTKRRGARFLFYLFQINKEHGVQPCNCSRFSTKGHCPTWKTPSLCLKDLTSRR